ncbi:MAG TPA: EamA family transporter, partial [Pirellulaceae bacterium]|nr:EamA family transporter [Pirellulaceae bacterium]
MNAKPLAAPLDDPAAHAWQGRLLVVAAAILWSTSGFFAKANTFAGVDESGAALWPGPLLAFWRAVFASLILLPLVRRPAWSPWLVPMVLCFVAMNWTYITALKEGLAATAIWLQSTSPVWVLLIGVMFLGEKFHARDGLLLTFGIGGVAVILFYELQSPRPTAVICGLTSGALYAGVVTCLRQLRTMDAFWMIALNHIVTAVCLAPYAVVATQWPAGEQWVYLAAFGILQMGIPYVLFSRGLRSLAGHEATGIGLIEPVLVPVWTYLAWGERVTWPIVIGGA